MQSQVRFVNPQQQDLYRRLPIARTIVDMTRRTKEAGNEQKIAFAQVYLVDTLVLVLIVVALGLSLWHGGLFVLIWVASLPIWRYARIEDKWAANIQPALP